MIRSLFLAVALTSLLSVSASAESVRTSPENILDVQVAGTYAGTPSGLQINRQVKNCSVSFLYDHEKDLGGTVLLYYKVKINFPNFNYNMTFLKPEDFEFNVSRDFLLNYYPKNFVLTTYSGRGNNYKALRLKFDSEGKLSAAQMSFGMNGEATSEPGWGWIDAFTCKL